MSAATAPVAHPDAAPLVLLRDLRQRWPGQPHDTLQIDAWQLAPGEAVFLRGPSGCGKSTLLSVIAGVLTLQSGELRLLGHDWRRCSSAKRDRLRADHIGYLFQQFNLLPYLSVLDNVLLPCRFSRRRAARATESAGSPRAAAEALLQRMGLAPALWHRASAQLSVGQQQRVAAARALIGAPELVIADEPTSALDEHARDDFMRLLLESTRAAGSALIFVSHDARLAAHFGRLVDLPLLNRAAQPESMEAAS